MAQSAEIYENVPLPLDTSNTIRLLRVKRRLFRNTFISCTLQEFQIDTSPQYTAVSYVWGTGSAEHTIQLQGRSFQVRQNLWDFLSQMRSKGSTDAFFWIDAICINQDDVAERTHQVRFMGQIYSKASIVLVWLGAGDPEVLKDMKFLQSHERALRKGKPEADFQSTFLDSLKGLEYWYRAWIVQECVLAARLYLQYDKTLIEADLFARWQELTLGEGFNNAAGNVLQARARWHERSKRTYVTPWALGYSISHCSDARDRIYSQLSLMHPHARIDPDYSKSCKDLLLEVVNKYISLDWWAAEQTIAKLAVMLAPGDGCKDYWVSVEALRRRVKEKGGRNRLNTKAIAIGAPVEIQAENQHFEEYQLVRAQRDEGLYETVAPVPPFPATVGPLGS